MLKFKILSSIAAIGSISVLALSSITLTTKAQNTTGNLTINAGALTLYPGDATDNNDLCAIGDTTAYTFVQDDGTNFGSPLTCSSAEQTVSYGTISVTSSRQTVNTTINDILFEDLSGTTLNAYSVAATMGNFINGGSGRNVALGANPDAAADESGVDADAPTSADAGKLYCTLNPQAGGSNVDGITPGAARASLNEAELVKGAKTTVIANATSVNIFSTGGNQVVPGRYDADGVTSKCRIPAYVDAGSYTQQISFTVTAS
jgi:hypothetical protein